MGKQQSKPGLVLMKALMVALAGVVVAAFFAGVPRTQATVFAQDQPPTTTVSPGPGTQYLGPHLWGILNQQASKQTVPTSIDMELQVQSDSTLSESLSDHVTRVGGSNVATNIWRVPTDKALTVVHRADVYYAKLSPDTMVDSSTRDAVRRITISHSRLDDTLDSVATGYANSAVTDADAAKYALFADGGNVLVEIQISSSARRTSVRNWLRQRSIHYLTPTQTGSVYSMAVLLPVSRVKALADAYSDVNLRAPSPGEHAMDMDRSEWTQAQRDASDALVATYLVGYTVPTESAVVTTGRPWEDDLTTRRIAHGVDKWLSSNLDLDGSGVKVGIIDWSFSGINVVPDLPRLDIATSTSDTSGNAFCQPMIEGVMAEGLILFFNSSPCQARAGVIIPVRHGVNIAELVNDMAPDAELVYAQANSPRQLYDATRWMVAKDVDVIVNAAGWNYDNLDNGVAAYGQSAYDTTPPALGNEHSSYRYYPSPNATVDYAASNGIVWVNAAGNQDEWTLRMKDDDYSLNLNRNSEYYGYVIFNPDDTDADDQTCQEIDVRAFSQNLYSLRWADTVPRGAHRVELILERQTFPFQGTLVNTTFAPEQFPNNYPVRKFNAASMNGVDLCLRIRVRPEGNNHPVEPEWIQFQVLASRGGDAESPDWAYDSTLPNSIASGHSIVNPSDSDNLGMLAVGAWNIRTSGTTPTNYSSRGPVYNESSNVLSSEPSRSKPDLVASTEVATYTKWRWDCDKDARDCDDLYFEGTSGATGQTGGITALVVGWFKQNIAEFSPGDIANYLRSSADRKGAANEWGHGLVNLPCPPTHVGKLTSVRTYYYGKQSWDASDCVSERKADNYTRKSDYYSFEIEELSDITVFLISEQPVNYTRDKDGYAYLVSGAHGRGTVRKEGGVEHTDRILRMKRERLPAGIYTVEATTIGANNIMSGGASLVYHVAILKSPATPKTSTFGLSQTLLAGGSSNIAVQAGGLTRGNAYTVLLRSNHSRIGFDQSCVSSLRRGFVATTDHHDLSLTVYSCGQTGRTSARSPSSSNTGTNANITVELRRGSATGTVLHSASHQVSVSTPVLSAPPAPSNVSAGSSSRTSINVSWSAVPDATKYRVEYRRGNYGVWSTLTSSVAGTRYRASGLSCGTTYHFRVAAHGDGINHENSWGGFRTTSARTSRCLPLAPAPTNVQASDVEKYRVQVTWDLRSGVSRYRVQYRAGDSASWISSSSSVTGASHWVTGLDCETGYQFRVQSYGGGSSYRPGWAGVSAPVSATTTTCPPFASAPARVVASTPGRDYVDISWMDLAGVAKWRIEYRTGSTGDWVVAPDEITRAGHVLTGLDCETAYDFRVSAYGDGEIFRFAWGTPSAVVSGTTRDCEIPYFGVPDEVVWLHLDPVVGTTVNLATAYDITEGDVLRYRIAGGNEGGHFAIDADTGEVTTRRALGNGPYVLTLEVRDSQGQVDVATNTFYMHNTYTARFDRGEYVVIEGEDPVRVQVMLDRPVTEPVLVVLSAGYFTRGGADDLQGLPVNLRFQPGESVKSFDLRSPDDEVYEGDERVGMTILRGVANGDIAVAEPWFVNVEIEDDDPSEVVLWDTTMTVGLGGGLHGYSFTGEGDTPGSLESVSFEWDGTAYNVTLLGHRQDAGRLFVGFDEALPSDLSGAVLWVGGLRLPFVDAPLLGPRLVGWDVPATWSIGEQLPVMLIWEYGIPER